MSEISRAFLIMNGQNVLIDYRSWSPDLVCAGRRGNTKEKCKFSCWFPKSHSISTIQLRLSRYELPFLLLSFFCIEDAQEVTQIGNGLLGYAEVNFWPWPFTCFSLELCASKVGCFYFKLKICKEHSFCGYESSYWEWRKSKFFLAEIYLLPSRLREHLRFCCIRWSYVDSCSIHNSSCLIQLHQNETLSLKLLNMEFLQCSSRQLSSGAA